MNRSLFRLTAYLQLGLAVLLATGCTPTQPFFVNESPNLKHYLDSATSIEYPDVEVASLPETTESLPPLTIGNHDYEFWNLTLEQCVHMALQNSKFFVTTAGNAEFRQNVATQFTSGQAEQFGSIYDIAIQQSTTQSAPLAVDGNGNRLLPRGAIRANQVGGVEDALAEFDAQYSAFFDMNTTDRAQNVGAGNTINPQFSKAFNSTQQSALSKRIGTGGVVTARQQILYSRNNTTVDGDPGVPVAGRAVASDYTAIAEIQIQHPLMRNRGTLVNRIPVTLASLNEDISITDFEEQVRNLVRDVEVAYWDLYVAYRNVSTQIIARNSAQATARFAKLNLEAGTGTRQELSQAEGQYYDFRARLKASLAGSNVLGTGDQLGVYGRERALREKLGIAPTDGLLIRPIDEPSLAKIDYDWNESVAQMLYLSPDLRSERFRLKQNELELMLAKNQILPDLNLSFLYRWVGVGDILGPPRRRDVNFPQRGSSAFGELTEGDFQELGIRVEFTPTPIGSAREMARVRNAKLTITRRKTFLQEQERLLVSQLSEAFSKAASHYGQIQDHANRWQVAESEVEARLEEYRKGLSNVNVVLQSQQRRAEAQITYYRALTEYAKSVNYIDYLKGTMLANSGITLREGTWNSKAYCDALERARERSAGYELQYGVTRPSVVRQGPLLDGEAATQIIGSGASSTGAHAPPSEIILDGPMDPAMGIEPSPLDWRPAEPNVDGLDRPLSEMGSPREMFAPAEVQPMPPSSALEPLPRESSILGPSTPDLTPPTAPPSGIAPMVYQEPVPSSGAPIPVARRPLPAGR